MYVVEVITKLVWKQQKYNTVNVTKSSLLIPYRQISLRSRGTGMSTLTSSSFFTVSFSHRLGPDRVIGLRVKRQMIKWTGVFTKTSILLMSVGRFLE